MVLRILTQAVEEPVTLQSVKNFLKLETDDDDSILSILIKSARQQLESQLGITFLSQEYLFQKYYQTPSDIIIRQYPIQTIDEVYIKNIKGDMVLEKNKFKVVGIRPIKISIKEHDPIVPGFPRYVMVKFKAGYMDKTSIPEPLRLAMLKLIAHHYEFRDVSDEGTKYQLPKSINSLIKPYQEISL